VTPGGLVATTGPIAYEDETLTRALEGAGARALVSPALLTYVPCAHQPSLHDGVADAPAFLVSAVQFSDLPVGYATSPFLGLSDLYEIERISIADSEEPPADVGVYRLRPTTRGEVLPPTISDVTS
jgi:hypothetical protein